ncbi:MAG: leucyl aminopeptidase [Candidatus Margulisiibacteriota bacterium]
MKINVQKADVTKYKCDLLFVDIFQEVLIPSGPTGALDKAMDGLIADLIKSKEIKGDLGKVTVIHTQGKIPAKRIAVLGLGKPEKFDMNDLQEVGAVMAATARDVQAKEVATIIPGVGEVGGIFPKEAASAILDGFLLGGYKFAGIKSKSEDKKDPIKSLTFIDNKEKTLNIIKPELDIIQIKSEATNKARDMINLPSNVVTPTYLAKQANEIAKKYKKVKVKVLERKNLERMKAGAFLSVAAGAQEPPKMIVMEYNNGKKGGDTYGIIGKGITFDSGGISLKSPKNMSEMKTDMSGAAAVLGVVEAVAILKLKVNLIAIIPATENMPDAFASKPGDIVTALSGKTIEIISTDAEGRMVMADALTYAMQNGATKLIDIATLTGGCVIALGEVYSGIMGNDQLWVDKVIAAGKQAGEKLWQLPIDKEYEDYLKSDVADIANCTEGGKASPVIGGMFLKEFARNMPWVHIDIAGTAYISKKIGCFQKGATGAGVRTIIELLRSKSE